MDIKSDLLSTFSLVNDWLKFAEAKNAILLTFTGAAITAISAYLAAVKEIPMSLNIGLLLALYSLGACSLVCAISFLPKTNLEHIKWLQTKPSRKQKTIPQDTDNFYYFNDLRKYSASELLDSMNRLYFSNILTKPYDKEILDISTQIVVNSDIASMKFKLFTCALWILIASILCIPGSILMSLLVYRRI